MAQHNNRAIVNSLIRVIGYTMMFGIPSVFAAGAATILIGSELVGIYEKLT